MAPHYDLNTDRKYSIAVVGGGIGGLCLAIGLLKQGINVTIYEAAPAFAEIGAGVALGPNAARAMKLIDPSVHKGFVNCMTNNGSPECARYWFSFRLGQDLNSTHGTLIHNIDCETGQASVHRAQFLDELVALVPNKVAHFGKRLQDIEDTGDHVLLKFADGTTATHDAMIGCDGIKSRTRQYLLGKDDPACDAVFTGKYAYRGLIPMDKAVELMGDELARNSQMYLGHHGHVLTFPIEHGKTMNVVAFGTKEDGKWDDPEWVKPLDRPAMEKDFEGWVSPVRQILSLMQKPDIWALFNHLPASTYFKGRVCVLGDAAHASTPHNGAGAGQAIEDALYMSRLLGEVYKPADIPHAFAAFDKVRRTRTQAHVKNSYETGQLYEFEEPGTGSDPEKIKQRLASKMAWYWNHDLEADSVAALKILEEERTAASKMA